MDRPSFVSDVLVGLNGGGFVGCEYPDPLDRFFVGDGAADVLRPHPMVIE